MSVNFMHNGVDYSKSTNRIHRNGAWIAYLAVCRSGSEVFADNQSVANNISKNIGNNMVGVRLDPRSTKGNTEVYLLP